MEKAKCAHCGEIIDHLRFESDVTQWGLEWGTADINGDCQDWQDSEFNDGETNETRYYCPNCEAAIDPWGNEDLISLDEDEDEEEPEELNEDGKPIKKTEPEEPKIKLLSFSDSPMHSYVRKVESLVCPECGYEGNPIDEDEKTVFCNKCGAELEKDRVKTLSFGKF